MGTVSRRILLALLLTLGTLCTVRAADRSAPLVYTALYPPPTPRPSSPPRFRALLALPWRAGLSSFWGIALPQATVWTAMTTPGAPCWGASTAWT